MRFTSVLVTGLAFATGALSAPGGDKKDPNACPFEESAANPLLPEGSYITADQEAIFHGLLQGISKDVRSIEHRCKSGKQKRIVKSCREYWEKMSNCVTTPEKIGQEHYKAGLLHIKNALTQVRSRDRTKNNKVIQDAQFNLVHQNLELVGFINELHGHEEVPQYLTDRPADVLAQLIHDLEIDVTKPLDRVPKKPKLPYQ